MNHLIDEVKISSAITPTAGAAGTTDIEGTTLDMAGFDGVLMVVRFGAITGSAVTSIKAQQGAASDLSDAADLAGTSQTVADTEDGLIRTIDIQRPAERYVRLYVDRGTQNAVVAEAHYVQYRARTKPTTQSSDVAGGEKFVTPAEGTA